MEVQKEQSMINSVVPLISMVRSLIACSGGREEQILQTEFYNTFAPRFYDRLSKAASKLYSGLPDREARVEEVFNDTFVIAFNKIKTFKIGNEWDDLECMKVILNWLSKIANNLLLKLLDSHKRDKDGFRDFVAIMKYDEQQDDEFPRDNYKAGYDRAKFDKFWNSLNPMSKEILIICINNGTIKDEGSSYVSEKELARLKLKNDTDGCATPKDVKEYIEQEQFIERNTYHLPDEALEILKSKYNVTASAIRKSKQRALEGLRNCKI